MQLIAMLFDLITLVWYLLYYIAFYIGILVVTYILCKDVIFNAEYDWLSKILIVITTAFFILASHIYWYNNYYYPIDSDAKYETRFENTANTTEAEEEEGNEFLPKTTTPSAPKKSVIDELNEIAKDYHGNGGTAYEKGIEHLQNR